MVVWKILKFFSPRPIKFSASAKGCDAENFEKFFLQGQPNFLPQPSVVVQKILKFFFFSGKQNFRLRQLWWRGNF
jgi:hypothetical protein